jgi:hypothetical protein
MTNIIDKLFAFIGYYRAHKGQVKTLLVDMPPIIHIRSDVVKLKVQFEYDPRDPYLNRKVMDEQIKREILQDIGRFIKVKEEEYFGRVRVNAELIVCEPVK